MRRLVFVVVLLTGLCCGELRAQSTNASVTGYISDPTKAVIVGAKVIVINVDTNASYAATTNNVGSYDVPDLPPGRYRIEVEKPGFKTVVKSDLILHVQDTAAINFEMVLGSTSEIVTVEAGALVMNTTDGTVSTVIDRNFVENIPLNGRSFQDLISLTPGVVTASPQFQTNVGLNGNFSVNGQRTESNSYIVDGISQNTSAGYGGGGQDASTGGNLGASTALGTTQSLISVDGLQEFRVESSTYSAEYGRTPGGQFSFVTRSGANALHGSVFDYLRNDAFDSNDWFNDYYGIAKPALRQNDFGGTVGGPVVIPKLYDGKDKTFFFVSYEGLRLTQPTEATLQYVPSNSLRSSAPSPLQPALNAFPLPTGAEIQIACDNVTFQCPPGQPLGTSVPSGLAPFIKAFSLPSAINATSVRLDHSIGSRIHTFFRVADTQSSRDTRYLSLFGPSVADQQTYIGGIDIQSSSGTQDELRIGYTRATSKTQLSVDSFAGATASDLNQDVGAGGYPHASSEVFLDFSGIGYTYLLTQDTENQSHQWNVTDTLGWSLGNHLIKTGADYRRISSPHVSSDPQVGYYYYSPASVLANSADSLSVERRANALPVFNQLALFAQDEWRVARNLSLSLGLRWELEPAPTSDNVIQIYPLRGDPNNPATYSLGARGTSLYNTTWSNFAPRLGAAWKIHGNSGAETVLRGGVGIFYDTGSSASALSFSSVGTLAFGSYTAAPVPLSSSQLNQSLAVTPPYGFVVAPSPSFQLPYAVEWNIAMEQAIGVQQTVTVSYVAASGQRLAKESFINSIAVNPDFPGGVELFENGLSSNYQSLQVQFQRKISHGFQALASYTWSHSLDYGSTDADLAYQRGNSDFDLRNNFNAAVTWELPATNSTNMLFRALEHGWGVDGRFMIRSGFPVTLIGNYYYDPITNQQVASQLDLIPGVPVYLHSNTLPGGRGINPNAFTFAPNNTLGNAPRNFVRGFGANQVNFAIRREFPLREGLRLQFRAEAFNILNHPNFGYIDPNLGDATFGQATSTLAKSLGTVSPLYQQGGARSMQLALKLVF